MIWQFDGKQQVPFLIIWYEGMGSLAIRLRQRQSRRFLYPVYLLSFLALGPWRKVSHVFLVRQVTRLRKEDTVKLVSSGSFEFRNPPVSSEYLVRLY
ncbi:hypothetical protein R1flu_007676 [Riccia fluitans]|uniref:Uncharacterized protein n=1 Tax=Riccia fluitans TaxID=41844 RepID=A0ABD1YZJ1_9MARC